MAHARATTNSTIHYSQHATAWSRPRNNNRHYPCSISRSRSPRSLLTLRGFSCGEVCANKLRAAARRTYTPSVDSRCAPLFRAFADELMKRSFSHKGRRRSPRCTHNAVLPCAHLLLTLVYTAQCSMQSPKFAACAYKHFLLLRSRKEDAKTPPSAFIQLCGGGGAKGGGGGGWQEDQLEGLLVLHRGNAGGPMCCC